MTEHSLFWLCQNQVFRAGAGLATKLAQFANRTADLGDPADGAVLVAAAAHFNCGRRCRVYWGGRDRVGWRLGGAANGPDLAVRGVS